MIKLKYSMLFILMVTSTGISIAQQKTTPDTWQFHSINSIGLLEGQVGSAFQITNHQWGTVQILVWRYWPWAGLLPVPDDPVFYRSEEGVWKSRQ